MSLSICSRSARDLQHAGVAEGVLVQRVQLAGDHVLNGHHAHTVCTVAGWEVGIVGTKGFVGGFPGSHLADFGERILRDAYAETSAEVQALETGLRAIAHCPIRIVLLHYAPIVETLEGEPPGIWMMLGSDRFAAPLLAHEPDLVLHGHAHAGSLQGAIGPVPVYNVAVPSWSVTSGRSSCRSRPEGSGCRRPTGTVHALSSGMMSSMRLR